MKKEIRVTFDMPDELHRDLTIHLASIRDTKKNFITDLIKEKLQLMQFEQRLNKENKTN